MTERPASASEFEIRELESQPSAAVRVQLRPPNLELGPVFDRWFPAIVSRIADVGGKIGVPAFGRYHAFGPELIDVEVGFPLASGGERLEPLTSLPEGEIGRSELPGGWVARTVHRGPYNGLKPVYDALHDWIHAQPGFEDGPGPWEEYLDRPEPGSDMSNVRTAVVWPLIAS